MVFYGCQTAASRNTLDSKPYGQYHNCLFLRVCQRFHIVSETFVKRKATFKGPIHLDYPHFHYSQSSCRFQPSHSLQGHIPSFYSITSRASRSANTALNALHPHTKKKKEKKNFRKGDFDIGCLQFDSLLLCSEIKNNTSLYNAHLEIVSVMKHSKQGSVRTANGFNISSEQKN